MCGFLEDMHPPTMLLICIGMYSLSGTLYI
jgi:hypothetical protein